MQTWIIEPRDPLIARDGRPFAADPGARAKSLPFPFPSTTAGTVRTRYGYSKPNNTGFDKKLIEEVRKIEVQGLLLIELNDEGEIEDWLLPAPADAVLVESDERQKRLKRLIPVKPPEFAYTNLPNDLFPIGFASEVVKQKPLKNAPRFWRLSKKFSDWLANPTDDVELEQLGHGGPEEESRVHLRIDPTTQSAEEGYLYQTSGLEFTRQLKKKRYRLALAVRTSAALSGGMAPLGGEQRLSYWRESSTSFPKCPDNVRSQIKNDKACRVILVTPAHFKAGFRPDRLLRVQHGVTPELVAAAVRRPQVVSGWDYEIRKPKPTRRLVPAGSVFFLKLKGDEQDIDQWINTIWMNCVSDDDEDGDPCQTRLDGFGLAALGVWSGEIQRMEVN